MAWVRLVDLVLHCRAGTTLVTHDVNASSRHAIAG